MLKRVSMLAVCLGLLAGCARQLPLALPPDAPARVTEPGGVQYTLDPTSETYHALERWIADNRTGWSWGHYYTPPPVKGVSVRAGNLDLQFFDSTVLAHTPQGDYRKSVSPSDYAFLTRRAGGT